MSRVIIEHKDGRRYSVEPADHKRLYPDFDVVGPETGEDFVATVPRPAVRRGSKGKKAAAPIAKPAPAAEPAEG